MAERDAAPAGEVRSFALGTLRATARRHYDRPPPSRGWTGQGEGGERPPDQDREEWSARVQEVRSLRAKSPQRCAERRARLAGRAPCRKARH